MSDDEDNGFRGHENMKVPLPKSFGAIAIPELFIRLGQYKTGQFERDANGRFKKDKKGEKIPILKEGWFIDKSFLGNKVLNKTRNISSRHNRKMINIYTTKIDKITPTIGYIPRLKEFPNIEDRRMIYDYLTHLDLDEEVDYPHNLTRGLPPILPKNWRKKKLGSFPKGYEAKEVAHEDIFGSDTDSDTHSVNGGGSSGEGGFEEVSKKSRGRPRKHLTTDEAYKAKLKSNKDKRAERAKEARKLKIQEKLSKGLKLTKKEKELHEAEGGTLKSSVAKGDEGVKEDPCWKGYEMVGMKTKKGKKVPNCVPTGGNVDFDKIHWGTFGSLMKRFLKKNPMFKDKIEDLEHFAHFVVANPDKFSKVAHKKSLFYVNILEHKK
jgi:hypothetical protein